MNSIEAIRLFHFNRPMPFLVRQILAALHHPTLENLSSAKSSETFEESKFPFLLEIRWLVLGSISDHPWIESLEEW